MKCPRTNPSPRINAPKIVISPRAKQLSKRGRVATWRVRRAIRGGWLVNLETRKGHPARLTRAYQMCYSRPPSGKELKTAQTFLQDYGEAHSRRATWAALCQALFAGAEFSQR